MDSYSLLNRDLYVIIFSILFVARRAILWCNNHHFSLWVISYFLPLVISYIITFSFLYDERTG